MTPSSLAVLVALLSCSVPVDSTLSFIFPSSWFRDVPISPNSTSMGSSDNISDVVGLGTASQVLASVARNPHKAAEDLKKLAAMEDLALKLANETGSTQQVVVVDRGNSTREVEGLQLNETSSGPAATRTPEVLSRLLTFLRPWIYGRTQPVVTTPQPKLATSNSDTVATTSPKTFTSVLRITTASGDQDRMQALSTFLPSVDTTVLEVSTTSPKIFTTVPSRDHNSSLSLSTAAPSSVDTTASPKIFASVLRTAISGSKSNRTRTFGTSPSSIGTIAFEVSTTAPKILTSVLRTTVADVEFGMTSVRTSPTSPDATGFAGTSRIHKASPTAIPATLVDDYKFRMGTLTTTPTTARVDYDTTVSRPVTAGDTFKGLAEPGVLVQSKEAVKTAGTLTSTPGAVTAAPTALWTASSATQTSTDVIAHSRGMPITHSPSEGHTSSATPGGLTFRNAATATTLPLSTDRPAPEILPEATLQTLKTQDPSHATIRPAALTPTEVATPRASVQQRPVFRATLPSTGHNSTAASPLDLKASVDVTSDTNFHQDRAFSTPSSTAEPASAVTAEDNLTSSTIPASTTTFGVVTSTGASPAVGRTSSADPVYRYYFDPSQLMQESP